MAKTLMDDLREWEPMLSKAIKEVRENQETDESFSRGYFAGMEMAYMNDKIRLQGIMNRHKEDIYE
jgi:hypothetical protein